MVRLRFIAIVIACSLGIVAAGPAPLAFATSSKVAAQLAPLRQSYGSTYNIYVEQFNLCFAKCTQPSDPEDLAAFYWTVYGTWAASLNETCTVDRDAMAADTGTPYIYYEAKQSVPGCVGNIFQRSFGDAVLEKGSYVGPNGAYQYHQQLNGTNNCYISAQTECRGQICAQNSTYAGLVAVCSAHLESKATWTATVQANEYAFVTALQYSTNRWLLGDFNLETLPSEYNSGSFQSLWSFDTNASGGVYGPVQFHLDWGLVDRPLVDHTGIPLRDCQPGYSDHCLAIGRFG